jgi:tRNA wybutosine-synthesizing protein 1
MNEKKKLELYKQGYRLVGEHSAIKACEYCREALRGNDFCYKQEFYGIHSHQCVQMTPSLEFCNFRCIWCWRDIEHTLPKWNAKADDPKMIVDECLKQHVKYISGFGGSETTVMEKYKESLKPNQFAISLAGEPTFYPRLPELIKEIKSRGATAFLVTNGTNPSMIKKMAKKEEYMPTNLYITLPAPDKNTFKKCCRPLIDADNAWKKTLESLRLMKKIMTRKTIRLTLVRGLNFKSPEKYSKLIMLAKPDGIEVKAYMFVGYSRTRLKLEDMPRHSEIKDFAKELVKNLKGYKVTKEKERSRVVLIEKE